MNDLAFCIINFLIKKNHNKNRNAFLKKKIYIPIELKKLLNSSEVAESGLFTQLQF